MAGWNSGRGLLGPLAPLLGAWRSSSDAALCVRTFRPFGKGWVELDARWEMEGRGEYREIALLGAMEDATLGFYSFTSDGKRSQGRRSDAADIHPQALALEATMPAGVARMIYWPKEDGDGFHFAVESQTKKGWNRFLQQDYRPMTPSEA